MLKRADLRLKRCFGQTEAPCRKSLKSGWPNAKMTKACSSRVENAVLYRKVYRFVQNSVFSQRSARTVTFALDAPLFNSFQQSA